MTYSWSLASSTPGGTIQGSQVNNIIEFNVDDTHGSFQLTASVEDAQGNEASSTRSVLVVGGLDASGSGLTSAEIYDPATQCWASAGNTLQVRCCHTAALGCAAPGR
ncbi:MAG: kelch repeat-containing protein [Holophaga sp.]|jgi:hypothetical protein